MDAKVGHDKTSVWDRTLVRLALFVLSYVAACAVATVFWVLVPLVAHPSQLNFENLWLNLKNSSLIWPLLPGGLWILVLTATGSLSGFLPSGWHIVIPTIVYFGTTLMGVVAASRRYFVVLYVVFVILLLLSVIGWAAPLYLVPKIE
jgi:hypothetical protein